MIPVLLWRRSISQFNPNLKILQIISWKIQSLAAVCCVKFEIIRPTKHNLKELIKHLERVI